MYLSVASGYARHEWRHGGLWLPATGYAQWGAFPHGLLSAKDLKDGTYVWKVNYTAIVDGEAQELERTGYIMVL